MNLRQVLAIATVPYLLGSFGLTAPSQAADPFNQVAQSVESPRPDRMRRSPRIDFAAAAVKLGVSEQKLKDALGLPANPPPRPELKTAAVNLGISEQKLKDALGVPANPSNDQGQRPRRPDLKAAAAKLGMTEQKLKSALGLPANPPPRPDFAAAAVKLGVTEQKLKDALGVPAHRPDETSPLQNRPASSPNG